MLRLLNRRKQLDTTPPTTPTLDTDLGGKAGTGQITYYSDNSYSRRYCHC
ncbi:hypothetical protein KQ239_08085 [Staphylococcus haemolyticus]|nr:hypothetical protein [Staphylococcus haemolyticus]MBW5902742.1 hypothetical protein [Staphylococcus haemolyticus]